MANYASLSGASALGELALVPADHGQRGKRVVERADRRERHAVVVALLRVVAVALGHEEHGGPVAFGTDDLLLDAADRADGPVVADLAGAGDELGAGEGGRWGRVH